MQNNLLKISNIFFKVPGERVFQIYTILKPILEKHPTRTSLTIINIISPLRLQGNPKPIKNKAVNIIMSSLPEE